jgi:Zn-dependent metalloprotease
MRDFVNTDKDPFGATHVNSGILSKAFYETAIRIGSERAGIIWTQALKHPSLPRNMTFKNLAQLTYKVAAGVEEKQSLKQAWQIVGIVVE